MKPRSSALTSILFLASLITAVLSSCITPARITLQITANEQSTELSIIKGNAVTLRWSNTGAQPTDLCEIIQQDDNLSGGFAVILENQNCSGETTVTPGTSPTTFSVQTTDKKYSNSVKITFTQNTLTINKQAGGAVTSSPDGIDCGTTCTASFDTGASITLTATPDPGFSFIGFQGDCVSTENSCTFTLNEDSNVGALFTDTPQSKLTINKQEGGKVTSSPAKIDCGETCSAFFNTGTSITLTATPDPGFSFIGFQGDCVSTSGSCTFTLNEDSNVGALFDLEADERLTLTGNGSSTTPLKTSVSLAASETIVYQISTPLITNQALIVELSASLPLKVYDASKALFASSNSAAFFASGNDGLANTLKTNIIVSTACRGACVYQDAAGVKSIFAEISNPGNSTVSFDLYAFSEDYADSNEFTNNTMAGASSLSTDDNSAIESLQDLDFFDITTSGTLRFDAQSSDLGLQAQLLSASGDLLKTLNSGDLTEVTTAEKLKVFSSLNRAAASSNSLYFLTFIPLALGQSVYNTSCSAGCHLSSGAGVSSANLANYNYSQVQDSFAPGGKMATIASSLSIAERDAVSHFVDLCFPKDSSIGCP